MTQLALLDADMNRKSYTDWQTGFWPALLLSVVTFGIYGVFVLYKLLERREQHFERMVAFRQHLIGALRERAVATAGADSFATELAELEGLDLEATYRDRYGEKTPVLWLVLGLLTGVTNFYVYYFLNDDFRAHEDNERAFLFKAASLMEKLGLRWEAPSVAAVPERRFIKFLLLTLVTIGLYGIYWWYTLIIDPNRHFDSHVAWESRLRAALGSR